MKKIVSFIVLTLLIFSCQQNNPKESTANTGIMWFNDNPNHTEIIIEGIRHFENIEFEKAYVYFEKAVRLDSTLFAPHVMLASLSRPNSAQQEYHYEKAKELVMDKNENSKRFVSLLDFKNDFGKRSMMGRGEKMKIWDDMIKDAPNGPFIQFYHAWSRSTIEERIKAMENLLALRLNNGSTDNAHILNVLGYSYMDSDNLENHTKNNCLKIHSSELDADQNFVSPNRKIVYAEDPSHQDLCDYEQEYFFKSIRNDLDLKSHTEDAYKSLQIALACDEAVKKSTTVYLD